MSPRPPRKWQVFACLTILGLVLTSNIESSAERAFMQEDDLIPVDFPVFYLGGKVALQRGATPLYYPPADRSRGYTLLYKYADDATPWAQMARAEGLGQVLQFTNPPFSAVLMAPLALMSWHGAYILWQIITLLLACGQYLPGLATTSFQTEFETFVMMFAAACFFFPLRNTLVFGQANVTILFLWTSGCVPSQNGKRRWLLACASPWGRYLKVSPVVAVPLLALRRQWRWLAAYVVGVGAFTGASVWALGWQTNKTWLTAIYPSISSGLGNYDNRSFAGLVDALCGPKYFANLTAATEWPVPHGLSMFEKACSLAIGLGFIFWCWRKRQDAKGLVDELILLPLVYLLAAPFSWPHHFVFALLPLTYLWAKAREATTRRIGGALPQHTGPGNRTPHVRRSLHLRGKPYPHHRGNRPMAGGHLRYYLGGYAHVPRSQVFDPQPACTQTPVPLIVQTPATAWDFRSKLLPRDPPARRPTWKIAKSPPSSRKSPTS